MRMQEAVVYNSDHDTGFLSNLPDPYHIGSAPLADAVPDLLGIEAHQAHERLITARQGGRACMLSTPNSACSG